MRRLSLAIVMGVLFAAPISAAPVPDKVPGLVRKLKDGKPGERIVAAEMLGDLGPTAADAIPALVEVIRETPLLNPESDNPRAAAINKELLNVSWNALSHIGPKAVPALTKFLSSDSAAIRGHAALALKAIGPDAAEAVPTLANLLRRNQLQAVCQTAIEALGAIGPKAEDAIPALVKMVLNPQPIRFEEETILPLRMEAAKALVAIGPKARPAIQKEVIPAIKKALKNAGEGGTPFDNQFNGSDWPVWLVFGEDAVPLVPTIADFARRRKSGWHALNLLQLGPTGHKALVGLLTDKDEEFLAELMRQLYLAIASREPHGLHLDLTPITPQLAPLLTHKNQDIRICAMEIFERSGSDIPPEVRKAALPLLDDIDYQKYQRQPDIGLWRGEKIIEFCGTAAIPKLLEFLKSDDTVLRKWAVSALANMRGPVAREKLLPLWRDLATGNTKDRTITKAWAATLAVRLTLDPKDIEALVPFLKSNDVGIRLGTVRTFAELRTLARPHVKDLLPMLKDEETFIRGDVARALGRIDPTNPEAGRALAKWFLDSSDYRALNESGFAAKELAPAVPAVVGALRSKNDHYDAVGLIERLGPIAKDAVPKLVSFLKQYDDPNFRDDPWAPDRNQLLRMLGAIGSEAKDAVAVIRKQMATARCSEMMRYLLCLADIGPEAKEAIPDLKELLIDPNPALRLLAACALAKIENDPAAYRAIFARRLREASDWSDDGITPRVFVRVMKDYPQLVPDVPRTWLSEPLNTRGKWYFWRELRENVSAAKPMLPKLLKYLNTSLHPEVRIQLIESLGAMGPDAKGALPKLRELAEKADFETAVVAKIAIEKIEAKK